MKKTKHNKTYGKRLTKHVANRKKMGFLMIMAGLGVFAIFVAQVEPLEQIDVDMVKYAHAGGKSITGGMESQKTAPQREAMPEKVLNKTIREVTAYNAGDPAQCDSSPCISANGENICTALALGYKRCAANFVPFGTKLEIENYGVCVVTDRMNSRFKNRVDIAMKADEKDRAIKFGLQNLMVKILE